MDPRDGGTILSFWPTIEKICTGWRPVIVVVLILIVRYVVISVANIDNSIQGSLWVRIIGSVHPAILGGVVLAHLLHERRTFNMVSPLLSAFWATPMIFLLLMTAMEFRMPIWLVWTLMVLLVGSVAISESNGLSRILRWRPIAHIGIVSYGMYLMHMLSFSAAKLILVRLGASNGWFWFPATVIVETAVSTISYR